MIRNHIQRLTGWNVPNITTSTSHDDHDNENVENSDDGITMARGDTTSGALDSAMDENHDVAAKVIPATNTNIATPSSMHFDENYIFSPQHLQPNKNTLRRTSDGSDGLTITSPLVDEKENQKSSGIRTPYHPPSPFGTTSNRNTPTFRTQSPLSNAHNTQHCSSFLQSPKNHLFTGSTFENCSRMNKISTTPLSSSPSSSPRRSTSAVSQENIRQLNSPRYNSSVFSSNSDFETSYEDNTNTDILPNPTSFDSLYTVQEIASTNSGGSVSENHQQMVHIKQETTVGSVTALDCNKAPNKTIHCSKTPTAPTLIQEHADKIFIEECSTSDSTISADSAPKELSDATTEGTDVARIVENYEWAYQVWKRHGLIAKRNNTVETSTKDTACTLLHNAVANTFPFKGPHHLMDNKKNNKPWNKDRVDNSFSNILDKWKSKTEEQPFDSPGSCTILQRASPQPSVNLQQPRKLYSTSDNDSLPSTATVKNINHVETKSIKPKWKSSSSDSKNYQSCNTSNQYVRHPAASLPIKELKEDLLHEGPSSPIPKSQAWKLKSSRDNRLQNSSIDQNCNKRTSWNPKTSMVERVVQGSNKVSESRTRCIESYDKIGAYNRSKSTPLGITRTIPVVVGKILAQAASPSAIPVPFSKDVSNQSTEVIGRSKSQPRDRQTFHTITAKTIQNNYVAELHQKRDGDTMMDVMRVIDLNITSESEASKFDIENVSMQLDDDSMVLSPYTQRVMRNLAKIYNESDNVKTPRSSETTMHPWQHDRLLHRVGSIADESNQEECQCSCSHSVFSGSDDLMEFFLPLMGTACICGQKRTGLNDTNQPTSLVNILRPWQVDFLSRFGIYSGEELVKSFHRSGLALAKAMLKFRKNEGMHPFPLKSSMMAIQIWSKTSKTFVRSIRDQLSLRKNSDATHYDDDKTELKLPNTLYIISSFMEKVQQDDDTLTIKQQRPVVVD